MPFTPAPRTTVDLMILTMQLIITHVFEEVAKVDERLSAAIKQGFDNAALDAERLALKGIDENSDDAATVLKLIEAMRTVTYRHPDLPRHGV